MDKTLKEKNFFYEKCIKYVFVIVDVFDTVISDNKWVLNVVLCETLINNKVIKSEQ